MNAEATESSHFCTANKLAEATVTQIRSEVLNPIIRNQFEADRGHKLRATLPDKDTHYQFDSHGFQALVVPNERLITNHMYEDMPITESRILTRADYLPTLFSAAEELWIDTFGDPRDHRHSKLHPGEFPVPAETQEELQMSLHSMKQTLVEDPSLDSVVGLLKQNNAALLSELFDISQEDIYTPGESDISVIQGVSEFDVPYNDGEVALLNPHLEQRRQLGRPVRGLVVGFDDTPVGVFGHVIDATNLSPGDSVTRSQLQSAMGFDEQFVPENPRTHLDVVEGTRVRIQGDLRVEYIGTVDEYSAEYSERVQQQEYERRLNEFLDSVQITNNFLTIRSPSRSGSVAASNLINTEVSKEGTVVVESAIEDNQSTIVVIGELLQELQAPVVSDINSYDDIPYIREPGRRNETVHTITAERSISKGFNDIEEALEQYLSRNHETAIKAAAEDAKVDAEIALESGKQANIPVDNHFVMIEQAFVPDIETEPVLALVNSETTLYIGHAEHNPIEVTIPSGMYNFSLLPRGLQTPSNRPDWQ